MKSLPIEFRKNTYDFKQYWRDDHYAIYELTDGGRFICYEVFKIIINKAYKLNGYDYPESEAMPSTARWGREDNAFSPHTIEKCFEHIERMRKQKSNDYINVFAPMHDLLMDGKRRA